jgi:transcriptional regulator with XRE-family HTH domain
MCITQKLKTVPAIMVMMISLSGTAVRELRLAKGWSQNDLSNLAGLGGQSVISNIERGVRFSPETEHRLREALGLLRDDVREPVKVTVSDAA